MDSTGRKTALASMRLKVQRFLRGSRGRRGWRHAAFSRQWIEAGLKRARPSPGHGAPQRNNAQALAKPCFPFLGTRVIPCEVGR
jgi:hypothetical protein